MERGAYTMIRMIRVPKQLLSLTAGYSQKQLKIILLMLWGYQPGRLEQQVDRYSMRDAFGNSCNISDIRTKLVASLHDKKDLFGYIIRQYPASIEYTFSTDFETVLESDDTEYIEFNYSLLSQLPNIGYSLKLLLLLLSLAKNDSCNISTEEAADMLFFGQTAYKPTKANAAANQFARLNDAVEDINTHTDYTVSITTVKEHRAVTAWQFSITTAAGTVHDTVSPHIIRQLLQKYDYDNPSEESTTFIALFCTNESDAASMVRDIAKEATMLTRAGIMDSGEAYRLFTRKAPLYPHKKSVLWYTTPKVRPIFEHFIYAHPSRFMRYLTEIIHNCSSYRDMLEFIKQEHLM